MIYSDSVSDNWVASWSAASWTDSFAASEASSISAARSSLAGSASTASHSSSSAHCLPVEVWTVMLLRWTSHLMGRADWALS